MQRRTRYVELQGYKNKNNNDTARFFKSQTGGGGIYLFFFFLNHHFCFPAQLVGGFTLSDLLDKPWSQVSYLLPPGTCLRFHRAQGSAFPLLVDFHRMLLTHALALSANLFFLCK